MRGFLRLAAWLFLAMAWLAIGGRDARGAVVTLVAHSGDNIGGYTPVGFNQRPTINNSNKVAYIGFLGTGKMATHKMTTKKAKHKMKKGHKKGARKAATKKTAAPTTMKKAPATK